MHLLCQASVLAKACFNELPQICCLDIAVKVLDPAGLHLNPRNAAQHSARLFSSPTRPLAKHCVVPKMGLRSTGFHAPGRLSAAPRPRMVVKHNAVTKEQADAAHLFRVPVLQHLSKQLEKLGRVQQFVRPLQLPAQQVHAPVRQRPQQQAPPPTTLAQAVDRAKLGFSAWSESVYHEHSYWVSPSQVEGKLPEGLRGTLVRNGPALFGAASDLHPLEGDGMVYSFSFTGDGSVFFQNKFVRTKAFIEERAGVQKHRQVFTRRLPHNEHTLHLDLPLLGKVQMMISPFNMEFRDAANVNVVHWGGKTVALYEHGLPHVLSNRLDTLGTLNLQEGTPAGPMAPHVRTFVEADGSKRLIMFVVDDVGVKDALATFYEFDEDFNLISKTRDLLPGGAFGQYHDMAITENFYVLTQNRVHVDFTKLVFQCNFGQASLAECLVQDQDLPVKVHLIPRPGKVAAAAGVRSYTVPGDSFFTFHAVNAYEVPPNGSSPDNSGGKALGRYLVLDLLSSKKFNYAKVDSFVSEEHYGDIDCRSEPHRLVIDLQAPASKTAVMRHRFVERFCEMPCINTRSTGKPHRHMYTFASVLEGGSFFSNNQAIMKITVDPANGVGKPLDRQHIKQSLWCTASQHHFVGEPVFVPRSDSATSAEDDGYLLVMVFDVEKRQPQLVVLNAQEMEKGPVATIKLAHHLCLGLHGMWSPTYLGPAKGTPSLEPYDIRTGHA